MIDFWRKISNFSGFVSKLFKIFLQFFLENHFYRTVFYFELKFFFRLLIMKNSKLISMLLNLINQNLQNFKEPAQILNSKKIFIMIIDALSALNNINDVITI